MAQALQAIWPSWQLSQDNVGQPLRSTILSGLPVSFTNTPTSFSTLITYSSFPLPCLWWCAPHSESPVHYIALWHAEKLLPILTRLFQPVISHSPPVSLPNLVLSTDKINELLGDLEGGPYLPHDVHRQTYDWLGYLEGSHQILLCPSLCPDDHLSMIFPSPLRLHPIERQHHLLLFKYSRIFPLTQLLLAQK